MNTQKPRKAAYEAVPRLTKGLLINDGGGSFRKLIYEYLDLDYSDAYKAGGMIITNALCKEEDNG